MSAATMLSAAPSREKLSRLRLASDLLTLGMRLMDTCVERADRPQYVRIRYRDGLLIALLIACPMRIKNLASLSSVNTWFSMAAPTALSSAARRTKTAGRMPRGADGPDPYINGWLQVHRPLLQLIAARQRKVGSVAGHLWLDRGARPMRSAAIRQQIQTRTKQAFGRHVWPHLFRDCAVTELVDCAPEEIGIAPDLLGHADLATTKKHYIQAVGMKAHARVQEVITARRRAAVCDDAAQPGRRGWRQGGR